MLSHALLNRLGLSGEWHHLAHVLPLLLKVVIIIVRAHLGAEVDLASVCHFDGRSHKIIHHNRILFVILYGKMMRHTKRLNFIRKTQIKKRKEFPCLRAWNRVNAARIRLMMIFLFVCSYSRNAQTPQCLNKHELSGPTVVYLCLLEHNQGYQGRLLQMQSFPFYIFPLGKRPFWSYFILFWRLILASAATLDTEFTGNISARIL